VIRIAIRIAILALRRHCASSHQSGATPNRSGATPNRIVSLRNLAKEQEIDVARRLTFGGQQLRLLGMMLHTMKHKGKYPIDAFWSDPPRSLFRR
jgi:hypothetical protein